MNTSRPQPTEYAPYYETYVSLVPDGDIVDTLAGQLDSTSALIGGISEDLGSFRYAPEKWSVKELLGHVVDSERVFGYRALRFARGDGTPLPGFDQDVFMRHATFDGYTVGELREEYEHVRRGHLSMFRHFGAEAWGRRGVASENEVSVRGLAYIMAGHELHHLRILRSRYLAHGGGRG